MAVTRRTGRRRLPVLIVVALAASLLVLPPLAPEARTAELVSARARFSSQSCETTQPDFERICDNKFFDFPGNDVEFTDSVNKTVTTSQGTAQSLAQQTTTLTKNGSTLTGIETTGLTTQTASGDTDSGAATELDMTFSVASAQDVAISGRLWAEMTTDGECVDGDFSLTGPVESGSYEVGNVPFFCGGTLDPEDQIDETFELTPGTYRLRIDVSVSGDTRFTSEPTTQSEVGWDINISLDPCEVSSDVFVATDDPTCEGLHGRITDGHGESLAGVRAELLDLELDPVGQSVVTNGRGLYRFPPDPNVPPDDYVLRVTLIDAENERIRTHYRTGTDPVRVDRQVVASDFSGVTPVDIDFTQRPDLASNIPADNEDHLDDLAVIHRRSKQYVDWLSTFGFAPAEFGQVTIRPFTQPMPTDCEDAGACYLASPPTVLIDLSLSLFNSRSQPNAPGPESVEWHELTHHLAQLEHVADHAGCLQPGDKNHEGWKNSSTCDSLYEGFASFLPTYAARSIEGELDAIYGPWSIEFPWKAWSTERSAIETHQREDLAVAALLWDLADPSPPGQFEAWGSKVQPADPNLPPKTVTYRDEIDLGFETVSRLVLENDPQTVKQLYDALLASESVTSDQKTVFVDLDGDGSVEPVTRLDMIFLLHGFFIPITDDLDQDGFGDYIYKLGTPIARTDHVPNPAVPGTLHARENVPQATGSEVFLRNDASDPITVTITVSGGIVDAVYTITLAPGEERVQQVGVPPSVSRRIEDEEALPECGPGNDALLSITISAPGVEAFETDSCEFAHAVQDSAGAPALTYAVTPPDGTIKGPKNAAALGDGIYNTTGIGQTSLTKVRRGKSATYQLAFQNDRSNPDTFTVTGCRSSKGFKVSYFDGATNVTSLVTGAGLSTGVVAPDSFDALTLKIKVTRSGPKNKSCAVTATSDDSPALRDVVLGKIKVKT